MVYVKVYHHCYTYNMITLIVVHVVCDGCTCINIVCVHMFVRVIMLHMQHNSRISVENRAY